MNFQQFLKIIGIHIKKYYYQYQSIFLFFINNLYLSILNKKKLYRYWLVLAAQN